MTDATISRRPPADDAMIQALFAQRRPGHTLPQALYMDRRAYEFDIEAIFERCWLFAATEAELPRDGDTLTVPVGATSVIIVRGRDRVLRAFYDTCRHRGARLCQERKSRRSRFVCPYHQWTYGLDGRLIAAGRMHEGFDRDAHGLRPVHLQTVGGMIFIALAEDAPDFAPMTTAVEPLLRPFALASCKVAHQVDVLEKGNWKLVLENGRECYHCNAKHPDLMQRFRDITALRGPDPLAEAQRLRCEAMGLPSGPVQGWGWEAARSPLTEGTISFTTDGLPAVAKPLAPLPDRDIGSLRFATEPNSFSHVTSDYAVFFRALPVAPDETLVTLTWLVNGEAVEGVDYDLGRLTDLWWRTNDEDRELVENNQRGVASSGYRPGPYSAVAEPYVAAFTDWYCEAATAFLTRSAPLAVAAE